MADRPASPRQKSYLESLLRDAGFAEFADARHAFGLTQKQAKGRFTSTEASALIDALLEVVRNGPRGGSEDGGADDVGAVVRSKLDEQRLLDAQRRVTEAHAHQLKGIAADLLADELRSRGWTVTEPDAS